MSPLQCADFASISEFEHVQRGISDFQILCIGLHASSRIFRFSEFQNFQIATAARRAGADSLTTLWHFMSCSWFLMHSMTNLGFVCEPPCPPRAHSVSVTAGECPEFKHLMQGSIFTIYRRLTGHMQSHNML